MVKSYLMVVVVGGLQDFCVSPTRLSLGLIRGLNWVKMGWGWAYGDLGLRVWGHFGSGEYPRNSASVPEKQDHTGHGSSSSS